MHLLGVSVSAPVWAHRVKRCQCCRIRTGQDVSPWCGITSAKMYHPAGRGWFAWAIWHGCSCSLASAGTGLSSSSCECSLQHTLLCEYGGTSSAMICIHTWFVQMCADMSYCCNTVQGCCVCCCCCRCCRWHWSICRWCICWSESPPWSARQSAHNCS